MRIKVKNLILIEGLIDEDFESQKVIPALAENMFKNFIKQYVEKVFLLRGKPDRFMVNAFKGLKFKYGKLNNFVANFMLFLEFDDKIGVGGHFQHSPNSGYGTIALNVDPNTLYSVFLNSYKYGDADNNEIMESMYYALRSDDLISVLIHETQHAYDYFISEGKFITDKSSKEFYKDKKDQTPKSDEKKSLMKVKYLRLKHEVNARFTQAINDMPWIIHTNDSSRLITPTEYIDEFKGKFAGWDIMTPKIKKYLLRRASQYYYKFKDEYENKKEE